MPLPLTLPRLEPRMAALVWIYDDDDRYDEEGGSLIHQSPCYCLLDDSETLVAKMAVARIICLHHRHCYHCPSYHCPSYHCPKMASRFHPPFVESRSS